MGPDICGSISYCMRGRGSVYIQHNEHMNTVYTLPIHRVSNLIEAAVMGAGGGWIVRANSIVVEEMLDEEDVVILEDEEEELVAVLASIEEIPPL